ncbi:SEA (Seh1-associated) complex subunit [Umbelopsis nana]
MNSCSKVKVVVGDRDRESSNFKNSKLLLRQPTLDSVEATHMPANSRGPLQNFTSQTISIPSRLSSDSTIISETALTSQSDGHDAGFLMDNSAVPPYQPVRYQLPGALNALSASPDGEYVVVAGREVLKVLQVTTQEATEYINLRTGSNLSLNYSSNDVKWGNNGTRNKIATAATNGAIIIWDLNKSGRKTDRVISEHSRAVNRVCFQPSNGYILLSASQDGNIKAWDLRDPKAIAKYSYEGKSESVRDVQFNPLSTNEFAAGFETGTIQKWDMRNPKLIYERKVSAHNGPCLTVDWHPDGRTLASGGRDRTIKVWDMTSDSRKPQYTIRTMASVSRIQWRPGYDNEIASCALLSDNGLHVWDVRRPNIAKYTFDEHRFQWLSSDVVISCAKDRFFMRHNIVGAYQPIELLRKNGIGWNIHGDLVFSIDKSSGDSFVDEISTPGLSNILARKQRRQRTPAGDNLPLQYIPPQTCGIAHLPLFDYETFSVFAQNYVISGEALKAACETNAKIAWSMQRFRAAQTWKIVQLLFADVDEDTKSLVSAQDGHVKPVDDNHLPNGSDIASESESEGSQRQTRDDDKDNDELSSASSESNELSIMTQNQEIVNDLFAYYTEQVII